MCHSIQSQRYIIKLVSPIIKTGGGGEARNSKPSESVDDFTRPAKMLKQ